MIDIDDIHLDPKPGDVPRVIGFDTEARKPIHQDCESLEYRWESAEDPRVRPEHLESG